MSTVHVVGGGLAGITAALACADAGHSVTLTETRARLGGLAGSFDRAGTGEVDTGQHVFLRCCEHYRGLLARLGVEHLVRLQERLDIPVLSPGRRPARLRRSRLPAPLHLAGALARYRPVSVRSRLALGRAALALRRVDVTDPATDLRSFGDWLAEHGQSPDAVAGLWDLVGTATLNAGADEASLALAATVFQLGLLTDAGASDIGVAAVPLGRLHDRAARAALEAAGVTVRTGGRVSAVSTVPATARGAAGPVTADPVTTGGPAFTVTTRGRDGTVATQEADAVVVALPPDAAARVLPEPEAGAAARSAAGLGTSPIVDVHVVYDRRVLDEPFAAGVASPVQWIFDRTAPSGVTAHHPDGQYVVVSLSAADGYLRASTADLRSRFLPALSRLLPDAHDARVLDFFVTREPGATFRPAPGSRAFRPPARTARRGLVLAGAWTDTGWPATMEGAVRSGTAAAEVLVRTLGHSGDGGARVAA